MKYKGINKYNKRSGLGRIRRASAKSTVRLNNLENKIDEDNDILELEAKRKIIHTGEQLVLKFNKLSKKQDLEEGMPASLASIEGNNYILRTEDGSLQSAAIRNVLKKNLKGTKNPLAVGDQVRFIVENNTAIIVAILPRKNFIARSDSHNKALLHVLASNIDALIIVTSISHPEIKPAFIDRYLLLAEFFNIETCVVINKVDLKNPAGYVAMYEKIGCKVITTAALDNDIKELQDYTKNKTCVFSGQSGVGKSSLINALSPSLEIKTKTVSETMQTGRHTTTTARSYVLDNNCTVIDTPGIRECGIPQDLTKLDIALLFADIAKYHRDCKYNDCTHTHEPDCAVKKAIENEDISFIRYENYLGILEEIDSQA